MQICFACRHEFPEPNLQKLPFAEAIDARLRSIRTLIAKLQPSTPSSRQCVAEMEDDLRGLVRAIDEEIAAKDARITHLKAHVGFLSEHEEALRKALNDLSNQVTAPKAPQRPEPPGRGKTAGIASIW